MNCCDANGDCRQGRDCPARCPGTPKRFPFAPGVIEGPEEAPSYITRLEAVILVVLVLAAIGSALAGWLA